MRSAVSVLIAGAVALGLSTEAPATMYPQRGMSGVVLGMTKAQVRARLGTPTADAGRWYYPRVWVGFRAGRAVEITTTRRTERTSDGVGVGSTEAQLRAALPNAVCRSHPPRFRRCRLGSGRPGTRVTDFLIGGRLVLEVTIQLLPR